MEDCIAIESVDCVRESGERTCVKFEVARPVVGDPYWSCSVEFFGMFEGVHKVEGSDSFQALCLGLMFIQRVLTGFVKNGGRVLYVGTDDDFPLNPYFQHSPV